MEGEGVNMRTYVHSLGEPARETKYSEDLELNTGRR